MGSAEPASEVARAGRQRRLRLALSAAALALALPVAVEACHVFFGTNLHAVIPGRVYRCAQLSGPELAKVIRAHGIRTVINLRGCGAPFPWYLDECRAVGRLGVSHEDVSMSAGRFPPTHELRRLVEILDRTAYPVLVHCRQGADRTGLASAVVLLLQEGAGFEEARRQLRLRYGHLAVGRPANLDRYLDLYELWLRDQGRPHSPAAFRAWLASDTCPGEDCGTLEAIDFPRRVPPGEPVALRVRARNTGRTPWQMRTGTTAGVHVCYAVYDADDVRVGGGRAGLFDAEVPPGQSIDLTLALPALSRPGRYRVRADLIDEPRCFFFQVGSEPLERDIVVGKGVGNGE